MLNGRRLFKAGFYPYKLVISMIMQSKEGFELNIGLFSTIFTNIRQVLEMRHLPNQLKMRIRIRKKETNCDANKVGNSIIHFGG